MADNTGLLGLMEDPASQGLLSFGLRMMATPGSVGSAVGTSGLGAMGDMQQAIQLAQRRKLLEQEAQSRAVEMQVQQQHLAQLIEQQRRQQAMQELARSSMTTPQGLPSMMPGSGGRTPEANAQLQGGINAQAQPQFDYQRYSQGLAGLGDPAGALAIQQALVKQVPKFSTAPQYDQNGRAFILNEQGGIKYLDGVQSRDKIVRDDNGGQSIYRTEYSTKPLGVVNKTQSPDSVASNSIAQQRLQAEFGTGNGGTLDANSERTAQAIASGQLPAPTGMALLNPRNQRVLGRVMEINPDYDSTSVDAKKKAARDFGSGQLGNSMRSFAVAGQHLDQLGTLVDALKNGNMPLVNKVSNIYSQQTGSPAVTNFAAAKDVVSKEVIKAIVAGAGGVAEREELSKLMANANSPQQLKGVITQYRNLMSAQHDALLQQRRAAGLPDSTLPNYLDANGSPDTTNPALEDALKQYGGGKR